MTSVVMGSGLGLAATSRETLGGVGAFGEAGVGRSGERIYVNAANGNLVVQSRDELLVGRGPDALGLRTYNSQGQFTDDNGDNWTPGLARKVWLSNGTVNTAGSVVMRRDADGSEVAFVWDAGRNLYVNQDGGGAYDTLSYGAVWTFVDGSSRQTETYDRTNGRLLTVADPAGNSLTLAYNAAGWVSSVTTASGEVTYYDYNASNQLTQLRTLTKSSAAGALDKTLTRVLYGYDASNRLQTVTVDLTPEDNSIADGKVFTTTYGYDGASKRVASLVQSDGVSLSFSYELAGGNYRIKTVTDANGGVTRFDYDTAARATSMTDALGQVTVFKYDGQNRLTEVDAPAVGGVVAATRFDYNANGDVTQTTDAEGHASALQYDAAGNLTRQADAAGNVVLRSYNAANQLLAETLATVGDPAATAAATRYVYDSVLGGGARLRFLVSAEGRVTEYRYDGLGQRTSVIQYASGYYPVSGMNWSAVPTDTDLATWVNGQDRTKTQRQDFEYDWRGQLTRSTAFASTDAAGTGVTDGSQMVTQYVYNGMGLLLQTVSNKGSTTQYTYDGLGRVLTVKDALNQVTATVYDDANNRLQVTLSTGLVSTSTYDKLGRLVTVAQTSAANGSFGQTSTFYDALGHVRMTQDSTGARTWYFYDAAGRKVGVVNALGQLTEFSYDKNNQVTQSLSWGTPVSTAGLVDVNGVPTPVTLASIRPAASANPGAPDLKSWNAYDLANRLVKTVSALGEVTEFSYDAAGRVLTTRKYATAIATGSLGASPSAASIAPATSGQDRLSRNFYGLDGLLIATLDGAGGLVEFQYDALGRQTQRLSHVVASDPGQVAAGSLTQVRPAGARGDARVLNFYNGLGQLVAQLDGENALTERQYDADGNLSQLLRYPTALAGNGASASFTAATALSTLRAGGGVPQVTTAYTYDPLNRVLTQRVDPNGLNLTTTTAYDGVNNRITVTDPKGTVTVTQFDALGRSKTATLDPTGLAITTSATYDNLGRVLTSTDAKGVVTAFTYDSLGRKKSVTQDANGLKLVTSYAYDAQGNLARLTDASGQITRYFYDADNRLRYTLDPESSLIESRFDALGNLTATIRYADKLTTATTADIGGGLVSNTLGSTPSPNPTKDQITRYAYDAAGRLSFTVDAVGAVTETRYDAAGQVTDTLRYAKPVGRNLVSLPLASDARIQAAPSEAAGQTAGQTVYKATDRDGFVSGFFGVTPGEQMDLSVEALGEAVSPSSPFGIGLYFSADGVNYTAFNRLPTQVTTGTTGTISGRLTVPDGARFARVMVQLEGAWGQTGARYFRNIEVTRVSGSLADAPNPLLDAATLLKQQLLPSAADQRSRFAYDAAGRRIYSVDPAGSVTQIEYDAAGRVVAQRQLANSAPSGGALKVWYRPNTNSSASRYLGSFKAGDVVTATVRFKSPAGVTGALFLGDAGGATPYDNAVFTGAVNGNDGWQTLTLTQTMTHDDDMWVYVYGNRDGSAPNAAQFVLYDNVRVSSVQRGEVMTDAFESPSIQSADRMSTTSWNVSGQSDAAGASLLDGVTQAQLAVFLQTLADASRDRTTRYAYDAADRQIYSVDAGGAVTQFDYDATGRVLGQRRYANAIALPTQGSEDGKTLTVVGNYGEVDGATFASIDTTRTYKVRARLRQLSGKGTVYAGVVSRDAAGTVLTNPNQGSFSYAAALGVTLTPDMGWQTFEGLITGETAAVAGASYNKFLAGSKTAAPLLLYNYYDSTSDPGRAVEVDSLELIDVATGAVVSGSKMDAGAASATVTRGGQLSGSFVGQNATLTASQIAERLRPDATTDRVTRNVYNSVGQVVYQQDALGGVTRMRYDANGRVIESIVYAQRLSTSLALTTAAFDAALAPLAGYDRPTRYVYDAVGRVAFSIDALGGVTESRYDALGRVARTLAWDSAVSYAAVTDAATPASVRALLPTSTLGARESVYAYDADGRLVYTARSQTANATQKFFTVSQNRYNALGQVTQTTAYANPVVLSDLPGNVAVSDIAARLSVDVSKDRSSSYLYDGDGRVVQVTDAEGYVETTTYDALGNKIRVTNKNGASTDYSYNLAGRLVQELSAGVDVASVDANLTVTTALGQRLATRYAYDAFGQLITRTEAAGVAGQERSTRYEYDALGHQVKTWFQAVGVYDAGQDILGSNGAGGAAVNRTETVQTLSTQTTYNSFGQAVVNRDVSGNYSYKTYDQLGRVVYEVDANHAVTEHAYSAAVGDFASLIRYGSTLSFTDGVGVTAGTLTAAVQAIAANGKRVVTSYTDRLGRVHTTRELADGTTFGFNATTGTAANAVRETRYTYNVWGDLSTKSSVLDPTLAEADTRRYAVSRYGYDLAGAVVREVDAEGYVTDHVRNAWGQDSLVTQYATRIDVGAQGLWALPPSLKPETTPVSTLGHDRITAFAYNRRGELASTTQQSVLLGNLAGTLTLSTRVGQVQSRNEYDGAGNLTRSSNLLLDANGTTLLETGAQVTNFYDALGRLTTTVNNVGNGMATRYDALGNAVQTSRYANAFTVNTAAASGGQLYARYSLASATPTLDSYNDQTTTTRFDALGRAVQVRDALNSDKTANDRYSSFDAAGRVVKQWQAFSDGEGTRNSVNLFGYDAAGQQLYTKTLIQRRRGDALVYSTDSALYNAYGEVTQKLRDGTTYQLDSYDGAGRLWKTTSGGTTKIYWYDLQDNLTASFTSTADAAGLDLSTFSTPSAIASYGLAQGVSRTNTQYDKLGRATGQTTSGSTHGAAVVTTSSSQVLDRWGNAISITRNGSERLRYRYNAGNQVIAETWLNQSVWKADGTQATQDLTKQIFYDAWGHNIGNVDAAGNANAAVYNVLGQLRYEYHADGGSLSYGYDGLGRQINKVDEVLRNYTYYYNRADQETSRSVTDAAGYHDLGGSTYDEQGRKRSEVTGSDSAYWGQTRTYDYDARGLLWRSTMPGGQVTQSWYDAAGRKTQEQDANGQIATWGFDQATGLLNAHTDIGGATYAYNYNKLGQSTQQTNSRGQNLSYSYFEDGQLKQITDAYRGSNTLYDYNADGNRTRETFTERSIVYRDLTSGYDSQGRLTSVVDLAPGIRNDGDTLYQLSIGFDAAGNRRRIWGTEREGSYEKTNTAAAVTTGSMVAFDQWFTYDAMNRVLIDAGKLVSGAITNDGARAAYAYDKSGRRLSSTNRWSTLGSRNDYQYDFANRLTGQNFTKLDFTSSSTGATVFTRLEKTLSYISGQQTEISNNYVWDTATKYSADTTQRYFDTSGRGNRTMTYKEGFAVSTPNGWTTALGLQQTSDQILTFDAVGNVARLASYGYAVDGTASTNYYQVNRTYYGSYSQYDYSYYLMEGYKERGQALTGSSWPKGGSATAFVPSYSSQSYDANGNLVQLRRTTSDMTWFVTDNAGHIVQRWASPAVAWAGNSAQYAQDSYFKQWLPTSATTTGAVSALAALPATPAYANSYNGSRQSTLFANDQQVGEYNYDFSRESEPGYTYTSRSWSGTLDVAGLGGVNASEGSAQYYTASAGDTASSVAQRYYGDAALWYVIADANALGGKPTNAIDAGRVIKIPRVTRSTNTNTSFAVYDPGKAIGNTSPDVVMPPPPPAKGGCGGLGMILMVVVVVVATVMTAGAAAVAAGSVASTAAGGVVAATASSTALTLSAATLGQVFAAGSLALGGGLGAAGLAAAAIGGAVGSIAGQGVAIATGMQDKFSWKQVGLSALGSSVTAGLGAATNGAGVAAKAFNVTNQYAAAAINAAASSIVTQGVAVATGLQDKFSWRNVAVSAIAAPVSRLASNQLLGPVNPNAEMGLGERFGRNLVNGVVSQGVRMLVTRSGRMDYASIAADAFGNALGDSLVASSLPRAASGTTRPILLAAAEPDPDQSVVTDAGRLVGGVLVLDEGVREPTEAASAMAEALARMAAAAAAAPRRGTYSSFDEFGNIVGISSEARERIEADRGVLRTILSGESVPTSEQIESGKEVLGRYGFRIGARESELEGQNLTIDEKIRLLRGDGNTLTTYIQNSARAFISADDVELADRSSIFSSANGGAITRIGLSGARRTIEFNFDADAARLAEGIGVTLSEARAKTDWDVYRKVIDAAFDTQGLESLRFNGLWRPTRDLFRDYYTNSQDTRFSGMTINQRRQAEVAAITAAGVTGKTINGVTTYSWSTQHASGNAVDIDRVNGQAVNNGITTAGQAIVNQESAVIGRLTDALWAQNPRSMLTPWRLYPGVNGGTYRSNEGASGDQFNHRNHIHFGN